MGSGNDFFRDTSVRYLGYANEVGEAFRSVVPRRVVNLSYKVAFGYVLLDTADKSLKSLVNDRSPYRVLVTAGDVLLWQTLASVIIPGFTINRICKYSGNVIRSVHKIPPTARKWLPVAIGVASIPIIIRPIDAAVTMLMNLTYRRIF